jgi:enoyl-CoA hydratase
MTTCTAPPVVADWASSILRFEPAPDHVGVLTLNRPDVLNAIDLDLYRALEHAFETLGRRDDVHVLVLRGAGRAFCAGGDITFMRQMFLGEIDKQEVQDISLRTFVASTNLPMPTIACVDGPAIGFGCTLALTCDLAFASDRAVFADPHVQMGLVPGDGGAFLWPLLIGLPRAKEFLFTGDRMVASDARDAGLINRVYPPEQLWPETLAFAQRLAKGPSQALRSTKAITNHVVRDLGERTVRMSLALELASQSTEYHQVAVARFLDGDPVRF